MCIRDSPCPISSTRPLYKRIVCPLSYVLGNSILLFVIPLFRTECEQRCRCTVSFNCRYWVLKCEEELFIQQLVCLFSLVGINYTTKVYLEYCGCDSVPVSCINTYYLYSLLSETCLLYTSL